MLGPTLPLLLLVVPFVVAAGVLLAAIAALRGKQITVTPVARPAPARRPERPAPKPAPERAEAPVPVEAPPAPAPAPVAVAIAVPPPEPVPAPPPARLAIAVPRQPVPAPVALDPTRALRVVPKPRAASNLHTIRRQPRPFPRGTERAQSVALDETQVELRACNEFSDDAPTTIRLIAKR